MPLMPSALGQLCQQMPGGGCCTPGALFWEHLASMGSEHSSAWHPAEGQWGFSPFFSPTAALIRGYKDLKQGIALSCPALQRGA